jgi:NAD(P)-dependent dehydrogenase (short-subunit alcohol dehydrogenase family)
MKLALITGSCRRLGAAIATRLATEGYSLALHGLADAEPEPELRTTLDREGVRWHGFAADLADAGQIEQLIAAIGDRFDGPPDLLVNNASVFGDDRLSTVTSESLLAHYAVNCAAPVLLSKGFAAIRRKGAASIINVLDQRIVHPHGDQLSYTLSKIALAGLTKILARELAPQIRVNAVAPGLTMPTADYTEAAITASELAIPLKRLPAPGQIGDAVAWLAQAGAVTGQTIYVDSGAHMIPFEQDFVNLD